MYQNGIWGMGRQRLKPCANAGVPRCAAGNDVPIWKLNRAGYVVWMQNQNLDVAKLKFIDGPINHAPTGERLPLFWDRATGTCSASCCND